MGLDLVTRPDSDLHAGMSYSGVHVHRRLTILLFVAFGSNPKEREAVRDWLVDRPDANAALDELAGRSGVRTGGSEYPAGVNYDQIPKEPPLGCTPLYRGLWLWVNHSDCDGEHSPDEVAVVAYTLYGLLRADTIHSFEPTNREWLERVADFYQEAALKSLTVDFR